MSDVIDFDQAIYLQQTAQRADTRLRPITACDFLSRAFPRRESLLSPWLPVGGLAMLYAPRGIGKTHVALNIAFAVASGSSFLRWSAPAPRFVLVIDGEMPAVVLQERLQGIVTASAVGLPTDQHLRILASDLTAKGLPDLSEPAGQKAFDNALGPAELIIVDNLSTLCRSGRENEAESWASVQEWALAQRREGRAVLFVHHAGKGGQQRGTSRREDVLDTVISLKRPPDYTPSQGARFEVHFEKARGFAGADAAAFEACLSQGEWAAQEIEVALEDRVFSLKAAGLSYRDIAAEIGKSAATVTRILKRKNDALDGLAL